MRAMNTYTNRNEKFKFSNHDKSLQNLFLSNVPDENRDSISFFDVLWISAGSLYSFYFAEKCWLQRQNRKHVLMEIADHWKTFCRRLSKRPWGQIEWRSPRPVCAAMPRVKVFAISLIAPTRSLHCVGEQRRSWPDYAKAQAGLDLVLILAVRICSKVSFLSRWSKCQYYHQILINTYIVKIH